MPIIRMAGAGGGFFGAAGDAAKAYDGSTADSRRQIYDFKKLQMRLEAQKELAQQRMAQQAQFQALDEAHRERGYQLDRQAFDLRQGQALMKGVVPLSGAGVGAAWEQLAGIDPQRAQALQQEFMAEYGGELGEDPTPEQLQQSSAFGSIHARTQIALADAMQERREIRAIQNVEATERAIREDFGPDLSQEELEEDLARLAVDLHGADAVEQEHITRLHRAKIAQKAAKNRTTREYVQEINGYLSEKGEELRARPLDNGMNAYDQISEWMGDLRTAKDPGDKMLDILKLVDPRFARMEERGYQAGFRNSAAGMGISNMRAQMDQEDRFAREQQGGGTVDPPTPSEQYAEGLKGATRGEARDPGEQSTERPAMSPLLPMMMERGTPEQRAVEKLQREGRPVTRENLIIALRELDQSMPQEIAPNSTAQPYYRAQGTDDMVTRLPR